MTLAFAPERIERWPLARLLGGAVERREQDGMSAMQNK